MVVRHHVRDHRRQDYHVDDYNRGHGSKVTPFRGEYHGPINGRLTYRERQKLSSNEFVFPERRAYPIDTANRARNALARVSQYGTAYEKRRVCEEVGKRYPAIHEAECPIHKGHTEKWRREWLLVSKDGTVLNRDTDKAKMEKARMMLPEDERSGARVVDPPEFLVKIGQKLKSGLGGISNVVREKAAEYREARAEEKEIRKAVRAEEEEKADEERREARLKRIESQEKVRARRPSIFSTFGGYLHSRKKMTRRMKRRKTIRKMRRRKMRRPSASRRSSHSRPREITIKVR